MRGKPFIMLITGNEQVKPTTTNMTVMNDQYIGLYVVKTLAYNFDLHAIFFNRYVKIVTCGTHFSVN